MPHRSKQKYAIGYNLHNSFEIYVLTLPIRKSVLTQGIEKKSLFFRFTLIKFDKYSKLSYTALSSSMKLWVECRLPHKIEDIDNKTLTYKPFSSEISFLLRKTEEAEDFPQKFFLKFTIMILEYFLLLLR